MSMENFKKKIPIIIFILMILIPVGYFSYDLYRGHQAKKQHAEDIKAVDKIEEDLNRKIDEINKRSTDDDKESNGEVERKPTKEEIDEAFRGYVGNLQNEFSNSDVIGRIRIPKLGLDYTLVHSYDNNEYLNLSPYGGYSYSGSIFLDKDSNDDFTDFNSRVFGHRMIYENTMFTTLRYFLDQDFVNSLDNYFTITGFGGEHVYDIVASFVIPSDKELVPLDYSEDFLRMLKEESEADFGHNEEFSKDDRFVTLIACTLQDGYRVVVVGKER